MDLFKERESGEEEKEVEVTKWYNFNDDNGDDDVKTIGTSRFDILMMDKHLSNLQETPGRIKIESVEDDCSVEASHTNFFFIFIWTDE